MECENWLLPMVDEGDEAAADEERLSGGGAQQLKLLAWLHRHMAAHYPVSKDAGARSGVMHRLDAETSGVLLCAKSYVGTHWLRLQWALHDVTKEYVALVHGWVDPATVEVRRRLRVESSGASKHCAVAADGSGRPAFTEVATLAHLSRAAAGVEGGRGAGEEERYSLVALKIHTGKTHQIRVHMLSLGHPLVCDWKYAEGRWDADRAWCPRHALHAYHLAFSDVPAAGGGEKAGLAPLGAAAGSSPEDGGEESRVHVYCPLPEESPR